jgi:two-component system, OmpR family, alkaline phosphatase synthesis response regulator PhoP
MEKFEKTILLVDDESGTLDFLEYNLKRYGYTVFTSKSGPEAIRIARLFKPKLILLDVMMPDMDGIETCIEIRKNKSLNDCMIAFLTCRGEDYSQIIGFNSGADDYIKKPVRFNILLYRLEALLKRASKYKENTDVTIGGFTLLKDKYSIIVNQNEIPLPKKEFDLLSFFINNPGKYFSREELLLKLWGDETLVGDRTVDVYINRLREKIGNSTIKTLKGFGYGIIQ